MDLSNLLMDVGDLRAPIACLKRLVQLRPDHAKAWQNLAVAQFLRGRYEDGLISSQEAIKCDPINLMAIHNMALALGNVGRYSEALSHVRRGLSIAPKDENLSKLEFRLKVMRIRAKVVGFAKKLFWPLAASRSKRS
jgi:tetratricopeptide (TPR) repeat protein